MVIVLTPEIGFVSKLKVMNTLYSHYNHWLG